MFLIILYVITCVIVCFACYHYCIDKEKSIVDRVAVGLFGSYITIVGCVTAVNIYLYKVPEKKIDNNLGKSKYNYIDKVLVERAPDERVQLTIVSTTPDSTYTVILSDVDAKKLAKDLNK